MEREDVIEKWKTGEPVCVNVKKCSDVWSVFERLKCQNNDELVPFVKCRKCDTVFKHEKSSSTSNLKRHKCVKLRNGEAESEGSEPPQKILKRCADSIKKECVKKLVNLCSKDLRSFNIVSGNGFREFVKFSLNTGAILGASGVSELDFDDSLPHPTTIARNTETICQEKRTNLCNTIRSLKMVSNVFLYILNSLLSCFKSKYRDRHKSVDHFSGHCGCTATLNMLSINANCTKRAVQPQWTEKWSTDLCLPHNPPIA